MAIRLFGATESIHIESASTLQCCNSCIDSLPDREIIQATPFPHTHTHTPTHRQSQGRKGDFSSRREKNVNCAEHEQVDWLLRSENHFFESESFLEVASFQDVPGVCGCVPTPYISKRCAHRLSLFIYLSIKLDPSARLRFHTFQHRLKQDILEANITHQLHDTVVHNRYKQRNIKE